MIESLRTTQIAFFRFATPCGFFRGSGGTKSIRARFRARENHTKPFQRTLFLGTRPSCLPSPGRPLIDTDDRKPNLWRTGSPVMKSPLNYSGEGFVHKFGSLIVLAMRRRDYGSHRMQRKSVLQPAIRASFSLACDHALSLYLCNLFWWGAKDANKPKK